MSILDEIFAHKRLELAARQAHTPLGELQAAARQAPARPDFLAALLRQSPADTAPAAPALIAEIKRRSPSRGLLAPHFDPLQLAHIYQHNGAAAISILTDERFFGGSLEILSLVAKALPAMPLLRKDFICDPYQVYEARAAGASAILLIAAMLEPAKLEELHGLALELDLAPLVEVHNPLELESVLSCTPRLVGVNNRDLHTFEVRLETTLELAPLIPQGVCLVAESGIHTPGDVHRLAACGVQAILVGEALVTAPNVAAKVRQMAAPSPRRERIGKE